MNRNNRKRIAALFLLLGLTVCLVLVTCPQAAEAFGDLDSKSDFGGKSDGKSSGVDVGTVGNIAWFLTNVLHLPMPVVIIIIVAIIALFLYMKYRKAKHVEGGPVSRNMEDASSLLQLAEDDPDFDEHALIERVKELFQKMDVCWENGTIVPLRKDFMPDTWTRFSTQLQSKVDIGETTHARDTVFDDVSLYSYETDDRYQILTVRLLVTRNIWTTDRDGKSTMGTEHTRKQIEYFWTMNRPLGSKTGDKPLDETHCPNCGAELDLEAFAECPFCHTPIMKISQDWVIAGINATAQTTIHE